MQFSIRRPVLPSAESHPEERLYRRLEVNTWLRHFNRNGQVEEEYKLRKVGWNVLLSLGGGDVFLCTSAQKWFDWLGLLTKMFYESFFFHIIKM